MPRHNMMWNLTMLRIMNAIDVFIAGALNRAVAHPLSHKKEEYILICQLRKEREWAWNNGPRRFIKFFKGVTP